MRTCDDVRLLSAEFALGLVTGEERSDVLAHLEDCPSCRREVDALAAVSDCVVQLAEEADPPAGFETRVLQRIQVLAPGVVPRTALVRRRPRWVMGAAAAVLLIVAVAGIAVSRGNDGRRASDISSAPMLTLDGQHVGDVYVAEGDPSWVFLTAPGWSHEEDEVYVLQAVLAHGQEVELGEPTLDEGSGAWGTATTIDVGHIRELALVDDEGHVWCKATLT